MEEMTLYKINNEIAKCELAILESIDTETGELLDTTLADKLKTLKLNKKDKLNGCIYAIQKREDKIELAKKEINRLKKMVEILEHQDERIRNYLLSCLEIGENVELGLHTISWRKSTSIEIADEDKYKEQYKDTPYVEKEINYKIKKTEIKKALQNGEKIEGAELQEKLNLQIK